MKVTMMYRYDNIANDVDGEGNMRDMNEETSKAGSKLENVDAGRGVALSEVELENNSEDVERVSVEEEMKVDVQVGNEEVVSDNK